MTTTTVVHTPGGRALHRVTRTWTAGSRVPVCHTACGRTLLAHNAREGRVTCKACAK